MLGNQSLSSMLDCEILQTAANLGKKVNSFRHEGLIVPPLVCQTKSQSLALCQLIMLLQT